MFVVNLNKLSILQEKKMKIKTLSTIALIGVLVCGSYRASATEAMGDFSADMVMTSAGHVTNVKMATTNGKTRMEMPMGISIMRPDLGVMWMVMPDQGMYMEQPLDMNSLAQASPESAGEVTRESLGREIVNGRDTEKIKLTIVSSQGTTQIYQWVAGDIMVRAQSLDGSWTVDYQNVQTGPQPDSLFEPPAGYQKMQMPSVGNLMAQMRDQYGQNQ